MKIKITETVLRDGQQSLVATRMHTNDFEAVLESMDNAGYYSVECWGGATFDSCIRFLKENPWERLRRLKSKLKKTKIQMLLRGQNLLGYKHYSDDVVGKFIKLSIDNGVDIIRIFDALNDYRNIEVAIKETILNGGHAQGCIVYTKSPIHNLKKYTEFGKKLENMGVHSICIKDMAGIMGPQEVYDLVKALKKEVSIPIHIHTHSITGLAPITYIKAIEAGCDGIDTSISAFSGGTSLPATETMNYALNQLGYTTGLEADIVKGINNFFKVVRGKFIDSGELNIDVIGTDVEALNYQIPGGMLSNLISQLKEQNILDRIEEVLAEIPRVRKDLGYPPLVTPMSQIIGVQATFNVLLGERYKSVASEVKAYLRGEYGVAPGNVDKSILKKILGEEKPIKGRFANTLKPVFELTKYKLNDPFIKDEDVITYILFPQIAEVFFKLRDAEKTVRTSYDVKVSKPSNKMDFKEIDLIGVDEKTAALVIAIMCDDLKIRPEEAHFKYIKAIE